MDVTNITARGAYGGRSVRFLDVHVEEVGQQEDTFRIPGHLDDVHPVLLRLQQVLFVPVEGFQQQIGAVSMSKLCQFGHLDGQQFPFQFLGRLPGGKVGYQGRPEDRGHDVPRGAEMATELQVAPGLLQRDFPAGGIRMQPVVVGLGADRRHHEPGPGQIPLNLRNHLHQRFPAGKLHALHAEFRGHSQPFGQGVPRQNPILNRNLHVRAPCLLLVKPCASRCRPGSVPSPGPAGRKPPRIPCRPSDQQVRSAMAAPRRSR